MGKTLCFTGHRPQKLGGFEGERALAIQGPLLGRLKEIVLRAYKYDFDTFISGAALGTDQMAMEAVIFYKKLFANNARPIKLIVMKPFPSQAAAWPIHAQQKYNNLCAQADYVQCTSPDPYDREKMQIRNEAMVDKSEIVVACWGGKGSKGGTANCVNYAREQNKPILIVNPYTLVERWELNKKSRW